MVAISAQPPRERSHAAAPAEYLHAASRSIEALLAGAGAAVPFYVFGHTHRAERVAIGPGAMYLNTGTWSTMLPKDLRAGGARTVLTFVEVEAGNGQQPRAHLLQSDREARRPAPGLVATHVGVGA